MNENLDKPFIIGIAGKAQSGKTTLAQELYKFFGDDASEVDSFANPLKSMLLALGYEGINMYKNTPHPVFGKTSREMLQTLGTEWGRNLIDDDIWVKAIDNKKRYKNLLIIDDVRFDNEAEYCRKYGCIFHIQGRGGIDTNHVSEQGVEIKHEDSIVVNSGSVAYMLEQALSIMGYNYNVNDLF